jgi:hypothetical protein
VDCTEINGKSGVKRLAKAKTLKLKAGEYILRIIKKDVPYYLSFWIRGDGMATGATNYYKITFKPGTYIYFCC